MIFKIEVRNPAQHEICSYIYIILDKIVALNTVIQWQLLIDVINYFTFKVSKFLNI